MSRVATALRSVRVQWHEAPWFVLLMILIAALIALIYAGNALLALEAFKI